MRKQGLVSLLSGLFFGLILLFGPGLFDSLGKLAERFHEVLSHYSSSIATPYIIFIIASYLIYLVGLLTTNTIFPFKQKLPVSFSKTLLFFAGWCISILLFIMSAVFAVSRFKGF